MSHLFHCKALYVDPIPIVLLHQPLDPQIPLIENFTSIARMRPLCMLLYLSTLDVLLLHFLFKLTILIPGPLPLITLVSRIIYGLFVWMMIYQPQFVSKMKHGVGGGKHPRLKGKVHLHHSFPSKVASIVSPRICGPCLTEEVFLQGCLFCHDGGHSRQNVMTSR